MCICVCACVTEHVCAEMGNSAPTLGRGGGAGGQVGHFFAEGCGVFLILIHQCQIQLQEHVGEMRVKTSMSSCGAVIQG